jgi:aminopeptidase YwaD
MALEFLGDEFRALGFHVDQTEFRCLDHKRGRASLSHKGAGMELKVSPYSLGFDQVAELAVVSRLKDLEEIHCAGKILFVHGDLCLEPLTPKGYPFYNPVEHQKIIRLLETKGPAAIIAATTKNVALAGALSPFPLIVDGDFNIPSAYCTVAVGDQLRFLAGESVHVMIEGERIPSTAANVLARRHPNSREKIVIAAHMDSYEDSPGALDNASGTVVLLLLAELFADADGDIGLEFAALNGEDHSSAGGQLDYLDRYGSELSRIRMAINVDGVGYRDGQSAYSFYGMHADIEAKATSILEARGGLVAGASWSSGDHMLFVQNGVPSIAFTSERIVELTASVTHTERDSSDLVDPQKLIGLAGAIEDLIRNQ